MGDRQRSCAYVMNPNDESWEFYYGGELKLTATKEAVFQEKIMSAKNNTPVDAFKCIVGDCLLDMLERSEFDEHVDYILTRSLKCAI